MGMLSCLMEKKCDKLDQTTNLNSERAIRLFGRVHVGTAGENF